jgi:hypothetical protein
VTGLEARISCGQSAAVVRWCRHCRKIPHACTNDFHDQWYRNDESNKRVTWRQLGKLLAGNTANGVLGILHEWKFHSGQDIERLPHLRPGLPARDGMRRVSDSFTPEGAGIPSSVCVSRTDVWRLTVSQAPADLHKDSN